MRVLWLWAVGVLGLDQAGVILPAQMMRHLSHHLLLYGTGEKFGSAGRSFDSRVLPQLRRSGYEALDLWLPGTLGRDVQAALTVAAATMPLARVELAPGLALPPEFEACGSRSWNWDGIAFSTATHSSFKGCVLRATINGHLVTLASETGRAEGTPPPEAAQLLVLPRAAGAAAAHRPARGALLLASVSQTEWQSASWLRLRRQWAGEGVAVLATATEGSVHLRLDADGRLRRRSVGL